MNFEEFDNIINETTRNLIDDCEYNGTEKENEDVRSSDSYDITNVEVESGNENDNTRRTVSL